MVFCLYISPPESSWFKTNLLKRLHFFRLILSDLHFQYYKGNTILYRFSHNLINLSQCLVISCINEWRCFQFPNKIHWLLSLLHLALTPLQLQTMFELDLPIKIYRNRLRIFWVSLRKDRLDWLLNLLSSPKFNCLLWILGWISRDAKKCM